MAASGEGARQTRRGPAPIASFDHDGSDESSPESKQTARLPEIREDACGGSLAAPATRARSHSTPACGALGAPPAPRIDISRASSSSHHDSRDSSPEMALFAGAPGDDAARHTLELGFREDGALDLRSSTEELAFLEPAPGEPAAPPPRPASAAPHASHAPPPPPPSERRHSRKDSQSSEAALLAVSGRTSRLSSVGSQCSAQSAISAMSRISRLSVASGASRSPSPHRMLLETSFCGPKPIETDPEISAGALVEQILGMAELCGDEVAPAAPVDARDRREVRTEATVESARAAPPAPVVVVAAPPPVPAPAAPPPVTPENDRDDKTRSRIEERRARPRVRREPSEPEVYKSRNKSKDIIRIKLKPDDSYEEEEEESEPPAGRSKPATLEIGHAARPADAAPAPPSPAPSRRRSPSPAAQPVSRKSSFCSLFKSRETIASPESPSEALRRKRSLTEGRSRSKSRDRSATPTSASKIRGSVLSLFRTPRRSGASPSPVSREGSPVVRAPDPAPDARRADKLKYYDDTADIIHIPLRTPPDEAGAARRGSGPEPAPAAPRPASAPQTRAQDSAPCRAPAVQRRPDARPAKPIHRTVLPDGSIIIPLRSPTERTAETVFPEPDRPDGDAVESRSRRETTVVPGRIENAVGPATVAEVAAAGTAPSPARDDADALLGSTPDALAETPVAADDARRRRKERLTFTTHVGSREQVFSTQFSITKTPSVTSEISGSFPSFGESEDARAQPPPLVPEEGGARDSSESEPSSEAAPATPVSDVERRGLVVQDSFEEELPYVPTTLPQERPVALPMVPVRERGGVRVSSTQRPRAAAPAPRPAPAATPQRAPPVADKLRIKLPRRPRAAAVATTTSTSTVSTTSPAAGPGSAPAPHRTRSGADSGSEAQSKAEWIDFEEVPERRKQPKRIQTLPAGAVGGGVVFSYVEPEQCRCECHAHDRLPLLGEARLSSSSAECGEEAACSPPEAGAPVPARVTPH